MAVRNSSSLLKQLFSRFKGKRGLETVASRPVQPFQAVSIYRGVNACAVAQRFSEHRFLAKDAPRLPLPGCTMPESCECRYIKHRDRRGMQRRHVGFVTSERKQTGQERRFSRGRRATD